MNWRAAGNTVLILSASLAVLGMMALLYVNVVHLSTQWFSNTSVSLFLRPGIPAAGRKALLAQVRRHPLVREAQLVSPEAGLRSLASKLGTEHSLLREVPEQSIPYTIDFEMFVDYRDRVRLLAAQFGALPAVDEVVYTEQVLDQVRILFTLTKSVGLFFIGLILLSFYLIVSHATRLSLHARQGEIEILELVGATRGLIRSAFVVEGGLISLAASVISLGIVWFCYQLLVAGLSWNALTQFVHLETVFFTPPILGAAAGGVVLLGCLSSYWSVNRLLREFEP